MKNSVELIEACGGISKHTVYQETEGHARGCTKGQCKQALKRDVVAPFLKNNDNDKFVESLARVKERFGQPTDSLPALPEDEIDELLNEVLEEEQDEDLQAERAAANKKRRDMPSKQADNVTLLVNGNFQPKDLYVTLTFNDDALKQIEDVEHADKILTIFLKNEVDNKLKKYGCRTKWLYVVERGVKNGRVHFHLIISTEPLPEAKMPKKRNKIMTDPQKQKDELASIIAQEWEKQYGFVNITKIRRLSKYKNALAAYVSKDFGGDRPAYAHRYHKSNNLIPIERETNDSDPRKMSRYIAAYNVGGDIALREKIESELPDGRCLLQDPEICIADGYSPFIRYFEIGGCTAFEDELDEVEGIAPLGIDLHTRIGNPRGKNTFIDSELRTPEYERTRGEHQAAENLTAEPKAKSYLRANPINPAFVNRYCGYGYGTYLIEDWETFDTVDTDDLPRRRELCKALHDRDKNQKALNYAKNKSGWAKCSSVVVTEKDIKEADEHEPVFRFLEKYTIDRARKDHALDTSQAQIYGMYQRDCESNNEPIRPKAEFDELLKERGIEPMPLANGRVGYSVDVTKAAREHFSHCSLQ